MHYKNRILINENFVIVLFSQTLTRMCWTNWWLDENVFKHCWHWWGLTSRPEVELPEPPPPDTPMPLPELEPPMPPGCPPEAAAAGPPKCMAAVLVIRYWKIWKNWEKCYVSNSFPKRTGEIPINAEFLKYSQFKLIIKVRPKKRKKTKEKKIHDN